MYLSKNQENQVLNILENKLEASLVAANVVVDDSTFNKLLFENFSIFEKFLNPATKLPVIEATAFAVDIRALG